MPQAADSTIPPGFVPLRQLGGYMANFGQLYLNRERRTLAVRIDESHLNNLGIPHGVKGRLKDPSPKPPRNERGNDRGQGGQRPRKPSGDQASASNGGDNTNRNRNRRPNADACVGPPDRRFMAPRRPQ